MSPPRTAGIRRRAGDSVIVSAAHRSRPPCGATKNTMPYGPHTSIRATAMLGGGPVAHMSPHHVPRTLCPCPQFAMEFRLCGCRPGVAGVVLVVAANPKGAGFVASPWGSVEPFVFAEERIRAASPSWISPGSPAEGSIVHDVVPSAPSSWQSQRSWVSSSRTRVGSADPVYRPPVSFIVAVDCRCPPRGRGHRTIGDGEGI
jgi:hypothetical protein